jgi:Na+/proline symporter
MNHLRNFGFTFVGAVVAYRLAKRKDANKQLLASYEIKKRTCGTYNLIRSAAEGAILGSLIGYCSLPICITYLAILWFDALYNHDDEYPRWWDFIAK